MYKCFICLVFIALLSCNNNDRTTDGEPQNAVDAARSFVQAALNNDFDKAATLMLDDSTNREQLNATARLNERLTPEQKAGYKSASIRIHETRELNDSSSVVYYSNSYTNIKDSIKVVRLNGKWLIDFKYIFPSATSEQP